MADTHAKTIGKGHEHIVHLGADMNFMQDIESYEQSRGVKVDLTPAERIQMILNKKSVTLEDKIAFSQMFAASHTDWIDVKEYYHGVDPIVVSNYNGRTVHRSDMKRLSKHEIEAVMRWRLGELRQRRSD